MFKPSGFWNTLEMKCEVGPCVTSPGYRPSQPFVNDTDLEISKRRCLFSAY
jgi:hypothetical protein